MMPGWGGAFGGGLLPTPRRFEEQYHCYSVAYADKGHLEKGDKILLPPSAFDTLARLQVDYPMLFRLGTPEQVTTHSGVLEFTAEEGCCYIPYWMMQNLKCTEGTLLTVTNVSLPKATYVKLQPQSTDFLEMSNPRAVLEHALRNFSCVTTGSLIQIPYNGKNYQFELKDVQPSPAACIIETDCNVDFDAPVGYVEPERVFPKAASNNSACPSPATTNASQSQQGDADDAGDADAAADAKPNGIRIVDGQIVRPDEDNNDNSTPRTSFLAESTGATGVQPNAAIVPPAPTIDYWALSAGQGARLDGKRALLKDRTGTVVDEDALRAAAAAPAPPVPTVTSKRKTRVGSRYASLKSSHAGFTGSAHPLHKK